MPETLAVIGSREGADLEHVEAFMRGLWATHPEVTIVSGGAVGVDTTAEQTWRSLGGDVISYRAKRYPDYRGDEVYGVERWDLGSNPKCYDLIHHPTFANYVSALYYRDMLIAAECTRLVTFMRKGGSRGSLMTCDFAEFAERKPVVRYEA